MSDNKKTNLPAIQGSGGGGGKGGGGSPSEVRDNQFSNVIAKVLVAYSSGQTDGLIGGSDGIFLDQTQLTGNFQGVSWQERYGTAGQSSIPGFERANSVVNVGVEMDANNPVIRTVTDSEVDAVRVIITIPALQDVESDGDIKGTSIDLELSVKDPSSGVWEERGTPTITGKSSGPFQRQYTIRGPDNITGAWDWRVTRITPNSTSSRLSNDSTVQAVNEIRYGKETYDDTAYVALEFDTQDFGNNIPALAFRVSGNRVRVPSNYYDNGETPSYGSVWNGSWKWMSTENPVWHIYHLLTDNEIGLGLDESFIDRYNFYESARYCDAVDNFGNFVGVPDGNGGVRRRFTLNTQITGQKDGLEMLQDIASSMRAVLYFGAGAVVLKQDMPRNVARIVTNENVKDGTFFYSSTPAKDRITVAKVGYNDPDDFFNIKYARYPSSSDWNTDPNIQRYGRNEIEVTKLGCTSEAEAYTFAKWIVYSSCNETRTVTFTGSPEFMLTRPGDILEIADRRLAGASSFDQRYGGRIAGGTTTSVILDYEVELSQGEDYTITIIAADGVTMETRNISTGAGTVTEVDVDAAFSDVPTVGYTWLIQGTDIVPQKYSVIHTERGEGLEVEVFAIQHDDQKFAAVEEGTVIVPKPYTKLEYNYIEPPQNLRFQPIQTYDQAKGIKHSLLVKWDPSPTTFATQYRILWRKNQGQWKETENTTVNEVEIDDATESFYEVLVYARSPLGFESIPLSGSYTLYYGGSEFEWDGEPISIYPPLITSDDEFTTKDLTVEWIRNPENDVPGIVFNDFVVEFVVDGVVLKTVTTRETTATYTYDEMVRTQGGGRPSNEITVRIRERDTFLHESPRTVLLMTNPVADPPTIITGTTFNTKDLQVKWDRTPPESGILPLYEDFEVEFVVDTVVVRREYTRDFFIIYQYDDMVQDQGTDTPSRTITVRIKERNTLLYESDPAVLTTTNPPASPLVDLEIFPGFNVIEIDYKMPEERDFAGVDIWIFEEQGVDPLSNPPTTTVTDNSYNAGGLEQGTDYWVRVRPFDLFGRSDNSLSSEFAVTTKVGTDLTGLSGWAYEVEPASRAFIQTWIEQGAINLEDDQVAGQLQADKLAALSVSAEKLADSAVTADKIANLAVGTAAIQDLAVDDAKVRKITAGKLTTGTINATETITAEGIFRAVDEIENPQFQVGMGPVQATNWKNENATFLFWALQGNEVKFGIDEVGNLQTNGEFLFGELDSGQYIQYTDNVLQLGPQVTIGKNEDQYITVGPNGDYQYLNDALEALSKIIPAYKQNGFTARITLLSDFVLTEQVIVSDVDLSWITINSYLDSPVSVDTSGFTENVLLSYKPAFAVINGGTSPRLDINLVSTNSVEGDNTCAYLAYGSNSLLLGNNLRASDFDVGFYVDKNARVECVDIDIDSMLTYGIEANSNAFIQSQLGVTVTSAGDIAIVLTKSSLKIGTDLVCSTIQGGSRIMRMGFGSELSVFDIDASFTGATSSIGIAVNRSNITASNITVSNATVNGLRFDQGSQARIRRIDSSDTCQVLSSNVICYTQFNVGSGNDIIMIGGSYLTRESSSSGTVSGVSPNSISANGIYLEH